MKAQSLGGFPMYLWMMTIPSVCLGFTYWDEMACRNAIFTNYSETIRPVLNGMTPVIVNISLDLLNIEVLSIKTQTLTAAVWATSKWVDDMLTWNPATYNGVEKIYVFGGDGANDYDVWKPDIAVLNAISEYIKIDNGENPIIVFYNGTVIMETGIVLSMQCQVDVTYYPFDTQTCDVIFGAWIYSLAEVNLNFDGATSSSMRINGEWKLTSITGQIRGEMYGNQKQAIVVIKLEASRRRGYYITQLIFPLVLLSVLNPAVFLLPPESGEKMSLAITTLLSYSVFLSFVGDLLPTTSHNTPVLTLYLLLSFILSVFSCCFAIVIIRCHTTGPEIPVPNNLKRFTCGFLTRVMFMRRDTCPLCKPNSSTGWNTSKSGHSVVPYVEHAQRKDSEGRATPEEHAFGSHRAVHDIDWLGVAKILDFFCFWIFFSITVLLTIIVIAVLFAAPS